VKIGHDLTGGSSSAILDGSGVIKSSGRIASVIIGGSIISGTDSSTGRLTNNATIRADDDIGTIIIKGDLLGAPDNDGNPSDGNFTPVVISARGQQVDPTVIAKNDVAIKSIRIGGRVEFAQILAGYDTALQPKNADAQIGPVVIGGNMIASSLIAGISPPVGKSFGTPADAKISGLGVKDNLDAPLGAVSRIASVIIKGGVLGTAETNDSATFAIAAQHLGALKVRGATIPLIAGPSNDFFSSFRHLGFSLGATSDGFDFHAFEVA
jgi:hypothetical protein